MFNIPAFLIHNHSDASNFKGKDSINKVENLILTAIELGLKGVCITDHETISNHVRAIKFFKKLKDNKQLPKDFKVGLGNEIYLVDREEEVKLMEANERVDYYHLILLAKDKIGHEGIKILSSMAWDNHHRYKNYERVPTYKDYFFDIIEKYKGHIICSTACLGGEFAKSLEKGDNIRAIDFIISLKNAFGEDFYIELQPSFQEDQIIFNKKAYQIAKQYNIEPIITTDSHYLRPEDRDFHRSYLQSQNSDREVDSFYSSTCLMNSEEIKSYIDYLPVEELLYNTIKIHEKIEMYDFYKQQQIPKSKHSYRANVTNLFKMFYSKYEYLNKFAHSDNIEDLYFLTEVEKGFIEKKQEFNEVNIARINEEMKEIWLISEKINQKMSSYYTLTKELIDLMWEVSYVGVSRGSSSGSRI